MEEIFPRNRENLLGPQLITINSHNSLFPRSIVFEPLQDLTNNSQGSVLAVSHKDMLPLLFDILTHTPQLPLFTTFTSKGGRNDEFKEMSDYQRQPNAMGVTNDNLGSVG